MDADSRPRTLSCADDNVHASQRRVRNLNGRVNGLSLKRFFEQCFNPRTNRGCIFFTRHVNEAGEEASKCVSSQEELNPFSVLQIQYARSRSRQVLH